MDYSYEKTIITDIVMKNETNKEMDKLLNSIKEKIGKVAFDNILKEIALINLTINKMADYIYSLDFLQNFNNI